MKALYIVVAVIIVAVVGYLLYTNYVSKSGVDYYEETSQQGETGAVQGQGKVYFGITDAAASLENVNS